MSRQLFSSSLLLAASALLLSACADDAENTEITDDAEETGPTRAIQLPFTAVLGDADFVSGECVEGVGSANRSMEIDDLRFYAANVEAKNEHGLWVPLTLSNRAWQGEGVTLIDLSALEVGSGTAGVNNYVQGTLPEGEYNSLRFTLGVPFELNHSNGPTAVAPLNVGSMFWSWQGGRKFLRVDGRVCGEGVEELETSAVQFHLGSTVCKGEMTNIESCDFENRNLVELDWSPGEAIVLDLDLLYAELDIHEEGTCMASQEDTNCDPLFQALGLPFGDTKPAGQSAFYTTDQTVKAHASGDASNGGETSEDRDHDSH